MSERSEFIRFSATERNSSNSFRVHASFDSFLEFIPMQIGAKKRIIKKTLLRFIPMKIGTKKKTNKKIIH